MRRIFIGSLILAGGFALKSQNLKIHKTDDPITIDGDIDEAWNMADSAYDFMQYFPFDTSLAESQTVAKILYDEEYIYVLGIMYNLFDDRQYITPSLRRDFRGSANDSFSVIFDPFKDHTNGMFFGINPFGVQREGLVTNGNDLNLDWDNKWYGKTKRYGCHWVAEMAIPFKTLRFNEGEISWNINFYRIDSENAERSTWSPISRNFSIVNMATNRKLLWDRPTVKPGNNISLIPYVAANYQKDFEESLLDDQGINVGGDIKYAVTPGLNLDLTINPDFSQVEVDQQQTNLSRFELFFPERRQFFLENADLFADFGNFGTRPFFTRRIGVAVDTATGQNIQNPIPFGTRLSGKVGNNTRVGLLSMNTGEDKTIGLPSYNYSVATMQQKLFTRSNVSFIFVNKQAFQPESEYDSEVHSTYNRATGVDFNLASADNVWTGKSFIHYSFSENQPDSAFAGGVDLVYNKPEVRASIFSQVVGAGYNPEVGFVRRTNIRQLAGNVRYRLFPEKGVIQRHGPGFDFDMLGDNQRFLDWDLNILYDITFRNTAEFNLRLRKQYTFLFDPFDPSGTEGPELPENSEYTYYQVFANYQSDARKKFFYELRTRSGEYFNGYRLNLSGSLSYRYQPFGFTSIDFNVNRIILPDPYTTANLFLVGPRFDFTFTQRLFWTTFVQYNSQLDNLNVNSRLQWRFAPVSDIFLVYTDNYFAYTDTMDGSILDIGDPRFRSLVFKISYWLNI